MVSYNSAGTLRSCVEALAREGDLDVIVVDNASADESLATVADLPLTALSLRRNGGFAFGCNRGLEAGSSPFVLFLNPDARIEAEAVRTLARFLSAHDTAGLVAPRVRTAGGELELSLRRFPRLRSTYSRAFFLHRLFPRASWSDEDVRDPAAYEYAHPVDWVSGACVLVRREALERIGGWDESFFHYGEDIDLCRRLWSAGYEVWFDPSAEALHVGGVSAPRPRLRPILVANRVRYARKHEPRLEAALEHAGSALEELTHALLTLKGREVRAGHVRALRTLLRRTPHASRSVMRWSDPTGVEPPGRSD